MSSVLAAKDHEILLFYPPLDDPSIIDRKNRSFFKKLREDLEKEVMAAQQRAKELFIK